MGTRANVLALIAERAEAISLSGVDDIESQIRCAEIINGDEVDALRDQLLDLLGRAAAVLHSETGRMALWHAIAKIPNDESMPTVQRQAARLIMWFDMASSARDRDDVVLNHQACDEFNEVITVVNALDRVVESLIAIVDVWLSLLPELTTADVDWLASLVPG
jgi:hypothetical protein